MKRARPFVLVGSQQIRWRSCQLIAGNFRQAYATVFGGRIRHIAYHPQMMRLDCIKLAREIRSLNPERVIFIEHRPHPWQLLQAIHDVYQGQELPDLVFHVYGDFTLYPIEWLAAEPFLRHFRTLFLCASPRQVALVKRFLTSDTAQVQLCPFGVDARVYHAVAPAKRTKLRRQMGLNPGSRVIVYTGRISLQKNVVPLLTAAAQVLALRPEAHLFLAGVSDTLLFSRMGETRYDNELRCLLFKLNPGVRKRIRLLGNVKGRRLRELYSVADVFASLSLHHDEDFGMAPAEAALSGLPLVLTDWGGYNAFVREPADGQLVPVKLGAKGLQFSLASVRRALLVQLKGDHTPATRHARAHRACERFSTQSLSERVRAIHTRSLKTFPGFSGLFRKLRFFSMEEGTPYPEGPRKGSLYEEVYSAYLA